MQNLSLSQGDRPPYILPGILPVFSLTHYSAVLRDKGQANGEVEGMVMETFVFVS